MAETRFATTRALFEEFPTLRQAVRAEPDDRRPLVFVRNLAAQGKLRDAVGICAYLLGRREAVWWTCQCLRSRADLVPPDNQPMLAAEAWLQKPDDQSRDIAFQWALASDKSDPATWAAYAAGSSGRRVSIAPDQQIDIPPHLTSESARVALVLAECKYEGEAAQAFLRDCLKSALAILERSPAS